MTARKIILSLFVILSFSALLLATPKKASAFSFGDVIDSVKNFFNPKPPVVKSVVIDSSIALAPEGDINGDKEINAGDIVRFNYVISNTTDKTYTFATIKTNIDRKQINYIHNVVGTPNLTDDGKTITIPNFRLGANQKANLSFDARINYVQDSDPLITTQADFVAEDKQVVATSQKKQIKALRISQDKIPGLIKVNRNKEN